MVHTEALWRVHRTVGPYRQRWDQMRTWGPVDSRWDPHPEPPGDDPDSAVMYAAPEVTPTLGEVFVHRRAITLSAAHALVGWTPTRALELLDLTGTWAVRNGASASLHAAPRSTCRRWAQAIRETWPELDGLRAPSTITLRPMVVLFAPALDSFPDGPALARALDHPDLSGVFVDAADSLGWAIRRV
ncbi:MAG: RES family NAD+ phosphorylase [Ornithinimicrobium sp.]|uniref:RES family NAD+ phosphorylase n=1 Tax=Ornithinimicrobium sp. TaxID=1977084 RepID=UPI003D9B5A52